MASTVRIVIAEKALPIDDIHQAVFEPMQLSWILRNLPDFDLHQRAVWFDDPSMDDQFGLWHRGYLTPYMGEKQDK
jgi:hypothetical protein